MSNKKALLVWFIRVNYSFQINILVKDKGATAKKVPLSAWKY